jgi:hypothetical protein
LFAQHLLFVAQTGDAFLSHFVRQGDGFGFQASDHFKSGESK